MRKSLAGLGLVLTLAASPALADQLGFATNGPTVPLSVSSTSNRVAIGGVGPNVEIVNEGGTDAYVVLGGSSVTASVANGYDVPAGQSRNIYLGAGSSQATYIAAITASGATTLQITPGLGSSGAAGGGGAGGGGGAVTAANGAFADGAITTIGTKNDNPDPNTSDAMSLMSAVKELIALGSNPLPPQNSHGVRIGAVEGEVAAGSAGTGYPVEIAGTQTGAGNGALQVAKIDGNGNQHANTANLGSSTPSGVFEPTVWNAFGVTGGASIAYSPAIISSSGTTAKIYITAAHVTLNGAGGWAFVYGPGANCGNGTGTTFLEGSASVLMGGTGEALGGGVGLVWPPIANGNNVCIAYLSSGGATFAGSISAAQY